MFSSGVQRSREPEGFARQNLSRWISPLHVAPVDGKALILDAVYGNGAKGYFS